MAEFYSKSLSPEAKSKLIDFIRAYTDTLLVAEVDTQAEVAKAKAIEVLKTDIDILVFITTAMTFFQAIPMMYEVINGKLTSRQLAEQVVELAEKARQADKSFRLGRN